MISLISFSQFSDVLLPFACGSAIGTFESFVWDLEF